ncbi:hypothetical protein AFL01nite_27200 [Aeromicrobium flavum]|uniref:Uncharacterized protein n=1 Tax=Aeromicrobium flavum TaxID=416568 RepID=A0A512HY63_9ACTN|nr:hypothetical protein [Aeromicrobium flavum]GEO90393.1 hypothetical protein AFL01nite_27200 [Aeromicrobium flavum]
MGEDSIWRTWQPYVVGAVLVVSGLWWYTTQSSLVALDDGEYACHAVFVNATKQYEMLTDEEGRSLSPIAATVAGGAITALSGPTPFPSQQLARLTVRSQGKSHFHVTDDPAAHSYNAVACDRVS